MQALRDAGIEELVAEFVAGNGFIPGVGVDDPELVDLEEPCKGAVPRVHPHFFTAGGEFGARDWTGADVDDGRWQVSGDELIVLKEFPAVTFRYRIDEDAITFEPLDIPQGCTSFRCG